MTEIQLPEQWVWKKLGTCATINPKLTRREIPADLPVSFLPMKMVEEVTGRFDLTETRRYSEVKKGFTPFQDGDVIFAKITPCMENGKIAVVDGLESGIGFGSTEFHVFRCLEDLNNRYLFYFLVQQGFRYEAEANMTGAVGQKRVPKGFLENYPVPLPPLPVQRAIVARIEELFSELEVGTRELQTALARLKTYRQAVLHQYLNNPDWERVSSNDLFDYVTSGSRGWAQFYSDSGAIFLRITNLDFNTLNLDLEESKIQHVRLTGVKEGLRTRVKPGDFLISITGYLGMFAIVPEDIPEAYVNQHIALCRPRDGFNKQFVGYFLMSQTGGLRQLNEMQKGATKAGLSLADIKSVKVPLPDLATQTKIVSEIEARLSEADATETTIRQQLASAENLRQSILKRAFTRQLVTEPIEQFITEDVPVGPEPANPVYGGQGDQLTLF